MPLPLAALAGLLMGGGALASGMKSKAQGGNFFTGKQPSYDQQSVMDPQQQELMSQILGGLSKPTGSGMDLIQSLLSGEEGAFEAFEAPYKQQFEQETLPAIAERFAGMGAQSSSAFNQTLGQAGKELSTNLASLRGGLQNNALTQLQGLLGQAFQPTQQTTYDPGYGGALGGLGNMFSSLGSSGFARLFGDQFGGQSSGVQPTQGKL